jgi:hypothetical protein
MTPPFTKNLFFTTFKKAGANFFTKNLFL